MKNRTANSDLHRGGILPLKTPAPPDTEPGEASAASSCSAIAWLHVLDNTEGIEGNKPMNRITCSEENPFGVPGRDYSEEYRYTITPLYLKANAIADPRPTLNPDTK